MKTSSHIAKHFKEVYFGGNWTCSNLKDNTSDLTWQQATTEVYSLNTIATLVYHINYYVNAVANVLEGKNLEAKDEFSFAHPTIASQEDWEAFLGLVWKDGKRFTSLIEKLPDETLWSFFTDEKYGIYFRNLQGIVEHTHYHLGQLALIKKIVLHKKTKH